MKSTRRDILRGTGALAAGVASSALFAPGPAPLLAARQEPVRLNLWKAPHNPDDQRFWTERLAGYGEEHDGVTVEYRITPWETWQETYTSAFAGDSPPDVSYVVDSFFPKFADAGTLVDLGSLEGVDLSTWEPLFDPTTWQRGTRDGKVYGLPFLQSGISLVWNKKLFSEAGLDPETPPKTWEELREFAKQLTKADGSQWGY